MLPSPILNRVNLAFFVGDGKFSKIPINADSRLRVGGEGLLQLIVDISRGRGVPKIKYRRPLAMKHI